MRTVEEIRKDALECLRMADEAKARGHKAILLMLAKGWATLADQAEQAKKDKPADAMAG